MPGTGHAETAPKKTLRIALTQGIDSLSPFRALKASSTGVLRMNYEFLNIYSLKDNRPAEGFAKLPTVSADKLTWTYRVAPGRRWSDGKPATARDAAFTFNLIMQDPAAKKANGNFVLNFASVRAVDDQTLVIRTKTPQSTMSALDVPIVPAHVWSRVGNIAEFDNTPYPIVGSGPFSVVDYVPDQYIRLVANPYFWRGRAKADELRYLTFKNTDAAVLALRKGEVDLANRLTPAQFQALTGDRNIGLNNAQGSRFYELLLNPGAARADNSPIGDGHPALRDVRVRQAIHYAIDKKALVERAMDQFAQAGSGYIPPRFKDFHWSPAPGEEVTFDPARAGQLLDQAGYRRGPGGIRVGPDGKPLSFRLLGHAGVARDLAVLEFLRGWLHQIGVEGRVQLMADNRLAEVELAGEYDIAISGWNTNPDPDYVLALQTCWARPGKGGTDNPDGFLCDPAYDRLYARQLSETERPKRIEAIRQAQQILYRQAAIIVLFYPNELEAYRSDRWEPLAQHPEQVGVIMQQESYWSYWMATPKTSTATTGPQRDTVLSVLGGGVAAALLVGAVVSRRRRATADERE